MLVVFYENLLLSFAISNDEFLFRYDDLGVLWDHPRVTPLIENLKSATFIIFAFLFFLKTLDLGKSMHSESFGPPFQRQNFFPRRAPGVLWGPPRGPVGVCPMSTPSDSLQMEY